MAFRDLKLQRKVHNNVNYLDKVQKVGLIQFILLRNKNFKTGIYADM